MLLHSMYCIAWKGQVSTSCILCLARVLKFTQPFGRLLLNRLIICTPQVTRSKLPDWGFYQETSSQRYLYLLQGRMLHSLNCALCNVLLLCNLKAFIGSSLVSTVCCLNLASCCCLYLSNLNMKYASITLRYFQERKTHRGQLYRDKNVMWWKKSHIDSVLGHQCPRNKCKI